MNWKCCDQPKVTQWSGADQGQEDWPKSLDLRKVLGKCLRATHLRKTGSHQPPPPPVLPSGSFSASRWREGNGWYSFTSLSCFSIPLSTVRNEFTWYYGLWRSQVMPLWSPLLSFYCVKHTGLLLLPSMAGYHPSSLEWENPRTTVTLA